MLAKINPYHHLAQADADNRHLLRFQVPMDALLDAPCLCSTLHNVILKLKGKLLVGRQVREGYRLPAWVLFPFVWVP
ncbi:hypothetical protein XENTR_v10008738 [Xenopus tropicalis]|nr:hypothetical protein XENTR_v10008738 [Xenopus tropicalis]KAE8616184.1 hypothetical protein XENTR_v10008738 [Xenopus tropicalis]